MPLRLAQHLVSRSLLKESVVEDALKRAQFIGGALDTALLEAGAVSEAGALQAMSDVSGVRLVNLADFEPNPETATLVPVKMARQLGVVPLSLDGQELHLATVYPLPKSQLKDLGFLLSRRLELWVAIEARVRDWQARIYGYALEKRFADLCAQLDPTRRLGAAPSEPSVASGGTAIPLVLTDELGVNVEPVLLERPKRRGSSDRGTLEEQRTALIDPTAYERYAAQSGERPAPEPTPVRASAPTRLLDTEGYEAFGREISRPESAPPTPPLSSSRPPFVFPGGVLPPRRSPAPPPDRSAERAVTTDGAPRGEQLIAAPSAPEPWREHGANAPKLSVAGIPPPEWVPPDPSAPSEPGLARPADAATGSSGGEPWRAVPVGAALQSEPVLPSPPGLLPSPATEWTLAQARTSLKASSLDREALVNVILEYGRRAFDYVAAFAVLRGAAVGWDARGEGDVALIRRVAIPLDSESVFRTVAVTRANYVGPLPPESLSQRYLELLGRTPRMVMLWPVEVRGRLVAILYGDCGARPVSQRRLADFLLFCQDLPAAFQDLILYRKHGVRPDDAPADARPLPRSTSTEAGDGGQGERTPGARTGDGAQDAWLEDLITLLTGPDASLRGKALDELLRTPEQASAALARVFPGPSAWSRTEVADLPESDELGPVPGALARLGDAGANALAPLLDTQDVDARYLALLTAGTMRHPVHLDGMLRGIFDPEPTVASAARAALAGLRGTAELEERLPALRQDLASADAARRALSARALGVLHDRGSIDGLINLAGSEDARCAQAAAEALRETTRQNFGAKSVLWTAWWAQARGRRRFEWLVDALESGDPDTRLAAIEELSKHFGDNAGFFANAPPGERAQAVATWRTLLGARDDLEVG